MLRAIPPDRAPLLGTDPDSGLTAEAVAERRGRFGSNRIAERPPRSGAALAYDTIRDPMIWFLLLTGLLFTMAGEYRDAAILAAAIIPLVGMDFYLHRRAEVSIEALGSVLASTATAVRAGKQVPIGADDLVPGDIVLVEAGASFPADGLLLSALNAQADESALTGESVPVGKQAAGPQQVTALGGEGLNEQNWVYAGTRLLTGQCTMIVVFTAAETLYGQIVQTAVAGPQGQTRLQKAVLSLVKILLAAALALCILLALVRIWQGFGFLDAIMSAATLAVAAIPEEFPVVLTFYLAAGVVRLARRRALVRHAVAVENIGRVSLICTDKTGTITEGRLALASVLPAQGAPDAELLRITSMAARSGIRDPLDEAIAIRAPALDPAWRLDRLYPFTEGRRHEAAFWSMEGGSPVLALKGAAEDVIAMCDLEDGDRQYWLDAIRSAAQHGEKVIGCAVLNWHGPIPDSEPVNGYRLVGLLGFSDPLKPAARGAIARAHALGVKVVMMTGDHADAAAAIAREAGISDHPRVVGGGQLDGGWLQDGAHVPADVFARVLPDQKRRIVAALRQQGNVVAVTGDGVNDVPALREADVGIAMGLNGTRSAREVAGIVLLDDNLDTIVEAIAEGRQLFANLRRSFAFLLMIHIPLVFSAAIIPFLGYPLLYLPVHIIWLELLIHPASMLAFSERPGENPAPPVTSGFFSREDWGAIAFTGASITIAVLFAFLTTLNSGSGAGLARATALISLIAALGAVILVLSRRSRTAIAIAGLAWLSSGLPLLPEAAAWLHLEPPSSGQWIFAFCLGSLTAAATLRMTSPFGREGVIAKTVSIEDR